MNRSESIKELATALATAQGEMRGAIKDTANPFFKSKYASLSSVVDAIREPLSNNGLSFVQVVVPSDAEEICVETFLMHTSGEWLSGGVLALPVIKADAQGYGSAMTYARRYSLSSLVGIAPEDDDGNAAAVARPTARATEPKQEGPKQYPDADFAKNFKTWEILISSGRKSADGLIDMIQTKGLLSEDQKTTLKAITRVRTMADVETAMRAATDVDTLAVIAVEQVAAVADPKERAALMVMHEQLEASLTGVEA
jgi:ERF superfamily